MVRQSARNHPNPMTAKAIGLLMNAPISDKPLEELGRMRASVDAKQTPLLLWHTII